MKHVFIIASHTSFLSAIGTAEYLKLKAEEVIMLYMRNYRNSIIQHPYKIIDVTEMMNDGHYLTDSRKSRKKLINRVDNFVGESISDQFHLYAPHMANSMWQVIYTHPLCVDVSYIQEGGWAYETAYVTRLNTLQRLKLLLNRIRYAKRTWSGGWYVKGTLYKQKVIHSYAISDTFFQYLPSTNHIIKWPKADIDINIKPNSMIFIFDGYIKNGIVEHDYYLDKVAALVEECAKVNNYIKFHPAQVKEEREEILRIFRSRKRTCEVMRDEIPLEIMISSCTGLSFAGFTSSLIFFARDYGHVVVSHEDWLRDSPLFIRFYKKHVSVNI